MTSCYPFKKLFFYGVALVLGGCSIHPLYTDHDQHDTHSSGYSVRWVVKSSDYLSFRLKASLEKQEHRLKNTHGKDLVITLTPTTQNDSIGIAENAVHTRSASMLSSTLSIRYGAVDLPPVNVYTTSSYTIEVGDEFSASQSQFKTLQRLADRHALEIIHHVNQAIYKTHAS